MPKQARRREYETRLLSKQVQNLPPSKSASASLKVARLVFQALYGIGLGAQTALEA